MHKKCQLFLKERPQLRIFWNRKSWESLVVSWFSDASYPTGVYHQVWSSNWLTWRVWRGPLHLQTSRGSLWFSKQSFVNPRVWLFDKRSGSDVNLCLNQTCTRSELMEGIFYTHLSAVAPLAVAYSVNQSQVHHCESKCVITVTSMWPWFNINQFKDSTRLFIIFARQGSTHGTKMDGGYLISLKIGFAELSTQNDNIWRKNMHFWILTWFLALIIQNLHFRWN